MRISVRPNRIESGLLRKKAPLSGNPRLLAAYGCALFLMAFAGATTVVNATGPALQGQVTLRPLTPQEIADYALTGVQGASGLATIGVGQPAYLDVLVNNAVPGADITNVVWTLSTRPAGSVAALTASPLGVNVPPFKMADRFNPSGAPVLKVAARMMLRPDVTGQYTVTASVQTGNSGSTNLTQRVTVGTYMGINTCVLCHSGGVLATDQYHPWSQTHHATIFSKGIDGLKGSHYSRNCIACHTTGHDVHAMAINGGFDDVATQHGWQFPVSLAPGNWASMQTNYPAVANLANVQCESCHGPGSEHAMALGNTNVSNWPRIDTSFTMGKCAQCHDSKPDYTIVSEWNNSHHARATRTPSGPTRFNCVRCHTAPGFQQFVESGGTNRYATNTVYEAITCSACHDPHDATHPHQLRAANIYTLPEGTTVTNVGLGAICMTCHHARNGEANQNITNYQQGLPTWAGGSSFGVHDSTAGDMVEGVNAITYGKVIPSGSHSAVIPNVCVGCHMQSVAPTHLAYGKAGGHTFSMTYPVMQGGVTNIHDYVDGCVKCHGPIDRFDFARKDYDGDGVIQGVQTEVQNLLNKLSRLLPNSTYRADGNYMADGLVKTSISVKTNWQTKFLQGAWNWQFVSMDRSKGVHNAPYAVGVLKASLADLTGDSNNDNIADWWQVQYFGSTTNMLAGPYATPANDGVPNWIKYNLGLNPFEPGANIPGGFVWGPSLTNPQGTNTVQIYTAAEIVFNTLMGTTYQIQSISALEQTWENVGGSIAGTGGAVSYVTPTRNGPQQYFRVVHTP